MCTSLARSRGQQQGALTVVVVDDDAAAISVACTGAEAALVLHNMRLDRPRSMHSSYNVHEQCPHLCCGEGTTAASAAA